MNNSFNEFLDYASARLDYFNNLDGYIEKYAGRWKRKRNLGGGKPSVGGGSPTINLPNKDLPSTIFDLSGSSQPSVIGTYRSGTPGRGTTLGSNTLGTGDIANIKTSPSGKPQVKPDAPKVDPTKTETTPAPTPDPTKTETTPAPTPDPTKVDPTPDAPKVDPTPDAPKVDPTPDPTKVDPTPDAPKVDPGTENAPWSAGKTPAIAAGSLLTGGGLMYALTGSASKAPEEDDIATLNEVTQGHNAENVQLKMELEKLRSRPDMSKMSFLERLLFLLLGPSYLEILGNLTK